MEVFTLCPSGEIIPLIVATILGACIGLERELAGKNPSLRTFTFICVGSCLFSLISIQGAHDYSGDRTRIAAQIVTGIGFLGAGTIFRYGDNVRGLTTAALMWVTASIGMAVGFGHLEFAVTATVIVLSGNYILTLMHRAIRKLRRNTPHNETPIDLNNLPHASD